MNSVSIAESATPRDGSGAARQGLSAAEAQRRLARDGANELPRTRRHSPLGMLLEQMREPMFLLLSGAAALYLLLGDLPEALVLCASVVVVVGMSVYQAGKSERALDALRDLSSPRAAVLRDGALLRVAARELVVGDIVLLGEGDRVPADARVLDCHDLRADESLLTGESVPVGKRAADGDGDAVAAPGTADSADVYSGTLIVAGHATAQVAATGAATAMGRIGRELGDITTERSPTQREVDRSILLFAAIGLALCVAVTALYLAFRGGWIDALLAGITLAIANIPEEFPVVLTVFLALGAWRLARQQVLTRRAPAIETLGSITVLCTDKTGTLTENRMRVAALAAGAQQWAAHDGADIPPAFEELLRHAALASELTAFDPMEKAILAAHPPWNSARERWRLIREYPLTPALLAHTHVWQAPQHCLAACKGAPEAIADLCALAPDDRAALLRQVQALAAEGLRVIGVARAPCAGDALPDAQSGFAFVPLGLVAFADPVRAGVADAVAEAAAAGVRTIMLTGDYPETARAIGRAAGLPGAEAPLSGRAIAELDGPELAAQAARHDVFARVAPEQKLRLVRALKAAGAVVAMTGDGVNDAPALKAAHVGIAMGKRGTDVAREAAAIVLLDDNFVSIVRAIRLGRTIYDNIERAMRYILAVHVPVTGLALLPLLLGGPLVFWPIHIVFLELVIDPACAVVFEREPASADVMRRPPRNPHARLFDARMLVSALLDGTAVLGAALAVYLAAWRSGGEPGLVAALTFASIVAGNIGLIALNRGGRGLAGALSASNAAFWWIAALAGVALAVALYVAPVVRFFHFASPPLLLLAAALLAPWALLVLLRLAADARRRRGLGNTPR